jgi:hypothetical protein
MQYPFNQRYLLSQTMAVIASVHQTEQPLKIRETGMQGSAEIGCAYDLQFPIYFRYYRSCPTSIMNHIDASGLLCLGSRCIYLLLYAKIITMETATADQQWLFPFLGVRYCLFLMG